MQQKPNLPSAVAIIRGSAAYPKLRGQVRFYQLQDCVLVEATIHGLPATETGFFGFHIHAGDRCSGADFADTLGHYNPAETPHPLHLGDLPPLMSCNGDAYLAVKTGRFRLEDILRRTVVIHSMPDDFTSQPAGNAGVKIACGIIRSANG